MANQYTCAYLVLHGYGFVTRPIATSTVTAVTNVSGDVWDVETTWAGYYSGLDIEDQIGSRVVLSDFDAARAIPDGEYTLVDVTSGGTRIVVRGTFSGTPTTGSAPNGTVRIEDFYKFSNSPPPDFVTGAAAYDRWLPYLTEDGITPTLGQKVDVFKAGIADVDGLTVDMVYDGSDVIQSKLLAYQQQQIVDSDSNPVHTAFWATFKYTANGANTDLVYPRWDDTTIRMGNINAIDGAFLADDSTNFTFSPVWIDQEAVILDSQTIPGSPTYSTVDVIRGVLRTRAQQHAPGAILIEPLPGGIGCLCQLLRIDSDALHLGEEEEIYYGLIENTQTIENQTRIKLELSDVILTGFRQKVSAKFSDQITQQPRHRFLNRPFATMKIESRTPFISDRSVPSWTWVKIGKAILRARDWTYQGNNGDYPSWADWIRYTGDELKYEYRYSIDTTVTYIPNQFISGSSYSTPRGLDNYFIVEPSDSLGDQLTWIEPIDISAASGGSYIYTRNQNVEQTRLIKSDAVINSMFNNDPTTASTGDVTYFANYEDTTALGETSAVLEQTKKLGSALDAELVHLFEQPGSDQFNAGGTINGLINGFQSNAINNGFNRKSINLSSLLLQILTSGDGQCGNSPNGPWDLLPYNVGLNIPLDRIDLESFGFIQDASDEWTYNPTATACAVKGADRWAGIELNNVYISSADVGNVAKWLTDNILTPFAIGMGLAKIDGVLKVRAFPLHGIQARNNEESTGITANYDDDDIYHEVGRDIEFESEIMGADVVESAAMRWKNITVRIDNSDSISYNQISKAIPAVPITTSNGGSFAQIYSAIQSKPIESELKFQPTERELSVIDLLLARVADFSKVLLRIKFTTTTQSSIYLGQRGRFSFDNLISPADGLRGYSGIGLVVAQKVDSLRGIQDVEVIIAGEDLDIDVWSGTAETLASPSGNVFLVDQTEFSDPALYANDSQAFQNGDLILLYDANWNLLSVDNLGDPDPRTITNIGTSDFKIDSDFTDGSGTTIVIADGYYITLAEKSSQGLSAALWAWQNDDESYWR